MVNLGYLVTPPPLAEWWGRLHLARDLQERPCQADRRPDRVISSHPRNPVDIIHSATRLRFKAGGCSCAASCEWSTSPLQNQPREREWRTRTERLTLGKVEDFIPPAQGSCLRLLPPASSPAAGGGPGGCGPTLPPHHAQAKHYTMPPLIPVLRHVTGQEQLRGLGGFRRGRGDFQECGREGALLCSLQTSSGVDFPGHRVRLPPSSADPVDNVLPGLGGTGARWGEPRDCRFFPGLREVQADGWMHEAREVEQGLKVSEGEGRGGAPSSSWLPSCSSHPGRGTSLGRAFLFEV